VDVKAFERGAGLAGVDEGAPEEALGNRGGVGVGQDDAGVVAAELQGEPLDGVRGGSDDGFAGGGGPGEHDLADGGVFCEACADVAAAGNDGQEAFGQFLVDDLDQGQDGEGSVFRGFDDDGISHPECVCDLPDGDHHGPVPRADRADDAHGAVVQFGVRFAVVHNRFRFQKGGGGGAQPGGAGAHLKPGVGAVEGFALLAGEQPGEFLGGAFDGVGRLEERGGPDVVAQGRPGRLRRQGGGNRVLKVFNRVDRRLTNKGAGGGVQDGPGVAGVRGDRGQQGVVGFHGLLHFE